MKHTDMYERQNITQRNIITNWRKKQKCKLTEIQIQEIRKMFAQRISNKHIAQKYGVDASIIHNIRISRNWKHIK